MTQQDSPYLVSPQAMGRADRRTIAAGTPGAVLMARAGEAVVRVLRGRWPRQPVHVLAGPGNNGGDGYVVAARLHAAGWPVTVYPYGDHAALTGDAAAARDEARAAGVPVAAIGDLGPGSGIIVDALFGAGLSRPIDGELAAILERLAEEGRPVLAVDLPSGVNGATGAVMGTALPAQVTVTFEAAKPGHVLPPGRSLAGRLHIAPIGVLVEEDDASALWNGPAFFRAALPLPPDADHKYARGGLAVLAGGRHTGGASRLTAHAGARAGAGAVMLLSRPGAADIHAGRIDAIMLSVLRSAEEEADFLSSRKIAAIAAGPGLGTDETAAERLEAVLGAGKPLCLDADALTLLSKRDAPFDDLGTAILTPHEGEFAGLFPDLEGDSITRARAAAERSGAVVLLKGSTTVIAAPGERPVVNTHSSPYLATAGSGDILTGIIAGFLAQGLAPLKAAAAGAWIHGEAARRFGPGLTADDLPDGLPAVLGDLAPG